MRGTVPLLYSVYHIHVTVLIFPVKVMCSSNCPPMLRGRVKLLASRVLGKVFEQRFREITKRWWKLRNENVHKA